MDHRRDVLRLQSCNKKSCIDILLLGKHLDNVEVQLAVVLRTQLRFQCGQKKLKLSAFTFLMRSSRAECEAISRLKLASEKKLPRKQPLEKRPSCDISLFHLSIFTFFVNTQSKIGIFYEHPVKIS